MPELLTNRVLHLIHQERSTSKRVGRSIVAHFPLLRMQNRKPYVWGLYGGFAVVLIVLVCAVTHRNPHGFFTLLRWVCCIGFAYSAVASRLLGRAVWAVIFALQAVLFNPFAEFHFQRDNWQTLDKVAIATVAVAAVMFWKEFKASKDA